MPLEQSSISSSLPSISGMVRSMRMCSMRGRKRHSFLRYQNKVLWCLMELHSINDLTLLKRLKEKGISYAFFPRTVLTSIPLRRSGHKPRRYDGNNVAIHKSFFRPHIMQNYDCLAIGAWLSQEQRIPEVWLFFIDG